MSKQKVILGSEECGTCHFMEGYVESKQDEDLVYMKIKPPTPSSQKIMDMMKRVNIELDGYPFCVEISDDNKAEVCDVDSVMGDLQKWYNGLDPKNK